MRNIFVLSILIIILLSANNSPFCHAQTGKNYNFSIGTHLGFVFGQSLEYLYPATTDTELLSELRYDMKPVFYYGLQIDFSPASIKRNPGFFASLAFKAGIPGYSGTHENRDWMSIENKNLTHFSSHTNTTTGLFWVDAAAGIIFPLKSHFYIKPFISGSWMHFSFSGSDGYGNYARKASCSLDCTLQWHVQHCPSVGTPDFTAYFPIDFYPHYYSFKGMEVIRYQQDWFLAALGFSAGTSILSPFLFEFTFQISPLTYCAAIDEHLTKNWIFKDFSAWGLFIEPKVKVSFEIDRFDFSIETAYRFIGRTRGPSYLKKGDNANYIRNNEAGAGLSIVDTRFLIRFIF